MKIIELEIEGYRSLKSQSWRPGDLNVLIGPNASGKSNLLRVLEMLCTRPRVCKLRELCAARRGDGTPFFGTARKERVGVKEQDVAPSPFPGPAAGALTYEIVLGRLGSQ